MRPASLRRTLLAVAVATATFAVAAGSAAAEDGRDLRGQPCWATRGTTNGIFHAAEIGCIPNNAPAAAPTAAPARSSQPPAQAQTIQPVQAHEVQPVQAHEIQPVQAADTPLTTPVKPSAVGPDFFFHTYALNVPGAVWTEDDWANWVETTYVAPGVPNTGGITINPDGTYVWNNTWEQRVIDGTWIPSTRDGYVLQLQSAEGGRDWFVGRVPYATDDNTDILLWGGQSLADEYNGRLAG